MATQGVTEEDLVIILDRRLKEELADIGLDIGTVEKRNEMRDTIAWAKKAKKRDEERQDQIIKTLRYALIIAVLYALFQGARYYLENGLDPVVKPQKSGVIYEHPTAPLAANGPLDRVGAPAAGGNLAAVAAATAGHPVQVRAGLDLHGARLLDRP